MTELKDTILKNIKSGSINMKPKWHFALQTLAFVMGLILVALLAIYLLSFILFVLHETGAWWLPTFGFSGWLILIITSPWLLLLIAGIFLTTLYLSVRHFGHNYRHQMIYSLLGVILFALAGTASLHYLAIHDLVRDWSNDRHIPGLSEFYRDENHPRPPDITPGTVTKLVADGIILTNSNDNYHIIITERTKVPAQLILEVGDDLLIFGPHRGTSTIEAKGIKPLPPPLQKQNVRREQSF